MSEMLSRQEQPAHPVLRFGDSPPVEIKSFNLLLPANITGPDTKNPLFELPRFLLVAAAQKLQTLPVKITPHDSSLSELSAKAQIIQGKDFADRPALDRDLLLMFDQRVFLSAHSRRTSLQGHISGGIHWLNLNESQKIPMGPIAVSRVIFQNPHRA